MFSVLSFFKRLPKARFGKTRKSPETTTARTKFIGSPLFNVLLMISVILTVSVVFRFLEWRRMNAQTQIQILDSESVSENEKTESKTAGQSADIFGGEVVNTSRRLREIGALGFAVCLSILDEAGSRKQIPGSISGLINTVSSRNLMPPGISVENGEIQSNTSKIFIRYQPQPLQIEFVSVPKEARFGPGLLLRFPLTGADGKNIAYFQSASVENINLPPPFAATAEIIRGGWTLEAWRGSEIGGGNQGFARILAEEQEKLKTNAPVGSGIAPR